MAGIKGMTGKNLGGARKGAGRKSTKATSTELVLSQEEVLENTLNKLKQIRDTTLASLAVQLNTSFEELVHIMRKSPEMLPPGFHSLEAKYADVQRKLECAKLLPNTSTKLLLEVKKQAEAL